VIRKEGGRSSPSLLHTCISGFSAKKKQQKRKQKKNKKKVKSKNMLLVKYNVTKAKN